MRLLRILGFRKILTRRRRHIFLPKIGLNLRPNGRHRLLRQLHPIRPHIGDQPDGISANFHTLIELLREAHRLLRGKPQLSARFLLQSRGNKRRRRVPPRPFLLHLGHSKLGRQHRRLRRQRLGLVIEIKLIQLLARVMRQPGREGGATRRRHRRLHRPIFPRPKNLDFGFPLANQPQRDRLHPPRGPAPRQLAPQHRREREPHQIIQRPSRQISLDQRLIQRPWSRHRRLHRGFGDLIKRHPQHVNALQRMLVLQHGPHMPGDRLPLPVRVGRQIQGPRPLQRPGDLAHMFGPLVGLPQHLEIIVRPHRPIFRRQIPHMPEGRQNLEPVAQIFIDRLGFGGGFNDNDISQKSFQS